MRITDIPPVHRMIFLDTGDHFCPGETDWFAFPPEAIGDDAYSWPGYTASRHCTIFVPPGTNIEVTMDFRPFLTSEEPQA